MAGLPPILQYGSPVNWAHPLNRGLVAWWKALPLRSGGGRWLSLVGTPHGTLTNMGASSATSGWGGTRRQGGYGEVRLDGSDDYVTMGTPSGYDFPDARFTVAGWARATVDGYLVAKRLATSSPGGYFVRLDSGGTLTARLVNSVNQSAGQRITTSTTLLSGAWFYWAVVFVTDTTTTANNDVTLYINGMLDQGSRSDSSTGAYGLASACPLVFGAQSDFVSPFLTGAVDDVRIANRGLAASEVLALYRESQRPQTALLNYLALPLSRTALATYQPWAHGGMDQRFAPLLAQ